MSFAKFSPDSDVYVFGGDDVDGNEVYVCYACKFKDDPAEGESYKTPSKKAILAHLHAHRAAGHKVQDSAFDEIRACDDWGEP